MGFTNAAREAAADAVTDLGTYISLHTGDPGTNGASEASGGSPAYARVQTTWTGGASDGNIVGSQVTIDATTGTYTHFGVWTAASGGTYVCGGALDSSAVLGAQGTVKVTPTVSAS